MLNVQCLLRLIRNVNQAENLLRSFAFRSSLRLRQNAQGKAQRFPRINIVQRKCNALSACVHHPQRNNVYLNERHSLTVRAVNWPLSQDQHRRPRRRAYRVRPKNVMEAK